MRIPCQRFLSAIARFTLQYVHLSPVACLNTVCFAAIKARFYGPFLFPRTAFQGVLELGGGLFYR